MGDAPLAAGFERLASKTFAGAKSYEDIRSAMMPSDRRYLNAFLNFPEERRQELLSALPQYYQESLQKIWSDDFGSVGEHDSNALAYFSEHAAVPEDSLLWHPSVPSSVARIKMIQGGIHGVSDNLHRFGFFESQGIEANLRFPSVHYQRPYNLNIPNFDSVRNNIVHQIRSLNPFDSNSDRTSIRKLIPGSHYDSSAVLNTMVDRREQVYFYMHDLMR
jgi:hypothetical protein